MERPKMKINASGKHPVLLSCSKATTTTTSVLADPCETPEAQALHDQPLGTILRKLQWACFPSCIPDKVIIFVFL